MPFIDDRIPKCQGKCKDGSPCKGSAVKGRRFCRMHGGKNPVGAAHGRFKHGGFSDILPERILETYQDESEKLELTSQREHLALVNTLIKSTAAELEGSLPSEIWAATKLLVDAARAAIEKGEISRGVALLGQIHGLADQGDSAKETENRVVQLIERSRRLSETETKREYARSSAVTASQLAVVIAHLQHSVNANVSDPNTRARIAADFARLLGGEADPGSYAANRRQLPHPNAS